MITINSVGKAQRFKIWLLQWVTNSLVRTITLCFWVSVDIKWKHFRFTAAEIHTRFSGMRSTYRANANKVMQSQTGSQATDVYVPTWPHYESLKFLDATQPTRTSETSYTVQHLFSDFESLEDTCRHDIRQFTKG